MKLEDAKAGMTVYLDGGFTCAKAGPCTVHATNSGALYFCCDQGEHLLEGQMDEETGELVGINDVAFKS